MLWPTEGNERSHAVVVIEGVKEVLGRTLRLEDRARQFDQTTGLFGSIPEFDSMAVVMVVSALEEHFGIVVEDDDISAEVFETIGTLSTFIEKKLGR